MCNTLCDAECKDGGFDAFMGDGKDNDIDHDKDEKGHEHDKQNGTNCEGEGIAPPPEGVEMTESFNEMCTKNPEKDFYCLEKFMELEKGGAFKGDSPSNEFPDLCKIDCKSRTGQAILELGCCTATMISSMER